MWVLTATTEEATRGPAICRREIEDRECEDVHTCIPPVDKKMMQSTHLQEVDCTGAEETDRKREGYFDPPLVCALYRAVLQSARRAPRRVAGLQPGDVAHPVTGVLPPPPQVVPPCAVEHIVPSEPHRVFYEESSLRTTTAASGTTSALPHSRFLSSPHHTTYRRN